MQMENSRLAIRRSSNSSIKQFPGQANTFSSRSWAGIPEELSAGHLPVRRMAFLPEITVVSVPNFGPTLRLGRS